MLVDDVKKIINSKKLSGYRANPNYMRGGEQIQALEREWERHFNVKYAIACNSATSGLWAALNAFSIGMKKDDEAIVSPYTMTCSATMPLLFGFKPVFADIEPDYFCLDIESIKKKITSRTRGIIIVDLFGQPYNPEINKFAKDNGLWIIEDAAQAIGSTCYDKFAGTFGDIGVYSLNQHKHLSAGEGGIIVTDDDNLALRLRLSINHAEAINNELNIGSLYSMVGMNLRMTEITACIARDQLKRIKSLIKPYIEGAKYFDIKIREGCESSYYKYATFDYKKLDLDKFDIKKHYITPLYKMPIFRNLGHRQNQCPVCEYVEENIWIGSLK